MREGRDIFHHYHVGDPQGPVFLLAPMEGVTAHTFRQPMVDLGGLDMVATEFIRITSGKQKVKALPRYKVPLQIQLMATTAEILKESILFLKKKAIVEDSDWLDLNVGCPSKKVTASGAGSALLCEPLKLLALIEHMREVHTGPLSIKTRIGYQKEEDFPEILQVLCDAPIDFISIHARTKQEGYAPGIHLDRLQEAVETLPYPVIGNGDIFSVHDVAPMLKTGVRGIMCGRGALRNPYLFNDIKAFLQGDPLLEGFQREQELLNFARTLCLGLMETTRSTGPFKEFSVWFSKNPLIGKEFFHAIKLMQDYQSILAYLDSRLGTTTAAFRTGSC